jgi:hypothetical protein
MYRALYNFRQKQRKGNSYVKATSLRPSQPLIPSSLSKAGKAIVLFAQSPTIRCSCPTRRSRTRRRCRSRYMSCPSASTTRSPGRIGNPRARPQHRRSASNRMDVMFSCRWHSAAGSVSCSDDERICEIGAWIEDTMRVCGKHGAKCSGSYACVIRKLRTAEMLVTLMIELSTSVHKVLVRFLRNYLPPSPSAGSRAVRRRFHVAAFKDQP